VLADDFRQRKRRIIECISRIDDALFGGIIKSLCLVHVATRADTGLLPRFCLVQKRAELFTLGKIGGELVSGR
jgi:hypothetical protein